MGLRWNYLVFLFIFAICSFSYAQELSTQEAVNYFNEGVKAQKEANFTLAETNYQKTFLIDPNNTDWQKFIFNNRGIMYMRSGDLDRAEAAFNEALKIDPNYKPAQLNLGFVYEKRRTKLESLEYWLKVLDINIDELKPKDFILEEQKKQ